ncbi:DMT family transporter [bacterium]|nr:DMT family transporter [candidate division CSSED10-310 bacterium]
MEMFVLGHRGEVYALLTACCWTITAMSFESAGKKVGSLTVNILRLVIALIFFSIYGMVFRGLLIPIDAGSFAWKWLGASAVVGFCIGDLCLFRAFVLVGSRISMLMMSAVPPMTALIGLWMLDEKMTRQGWVGMVLTVAGISMAVLMKASGKNVPLSSNKQHIKGVFFAIIGALGQAFGLILSKRGMGQFDAVSSTHIRVIVGVIGFSFIFFVSGRWHCVVDALRNYRAMASILLGSIFGPFLGVSLSLLAIQRTDAGIASTIMAIVPVLIIPPAILIFREKVSILEGVGAILAVSGVALLFL